MALCHRACIKDHVDLWSSEPQSITWNPEDRDEVVEETVLKNSGAISLRKLGILLEFENKFSVIPEELNCLLCS